MHYLKFLQELEESLRAESKDFLLQDRDAQLNSSISSSKREEGILLTRKIYRRCILNCDHS